MIERRLIRGIEFCCTRKEAIVSFLDVWPSVADRRTHGGVLGVLTRDRMWQVCRG